MLKILKNVKNFEKCLKFGKMLIFFKNAENLKNHQNCGIGKFWKKNCENCSVLEKMKENDKFENNFSKKNKILRKKDWNVAKFWNPYLNFRY